MHGTVLNIKIPFRYTNFDFIQTASFIENLIFGNVPNAKEGFEYNSMKNNYSPNIEIEYRKSKNENRTNL